VAGDRRDPSPARSFWSGRIVLVLLAALVAEYGLVRRNWVVGAIGAVVALGAAAYASYTWFRERPGR